MEHFTRGGKEEERKDGDTRGREREGERGKGRGMRGEGAVKRNIFTRKGGSMDHFRADGRCKGKG